MSKLQNHFKRETTTITLKDGKFYKVFNFDPDFIEMPLTKIDEYLNEIASILFIKQIRKKVGLYSGEAMLMRLFGMFG